MIDIYEDISEHRRKRRRLEQPAVPLNASDSSNDENSGSVSNFDSDNDAQNQDAPADPSADDTDGMELDRSHHVSEYPSQSASSPGPNHYRDQHPPPLNLENGNPLLTQDEDFKPDLSTPQQHAQASPATSSPSPVSSPSKSRYISSKPNPYHSKREDHAPSSNSEDDLPAKHDEPMPYSSQDEDDIDGIPLYSHPMSPADWPTE